MSFGPFYFFLIYFFVCRCVLTSIVILGHCEKFGDFSSCKMGRLENSDLAIVTIHRPSEFANDRIVLPSGATSVLSGKCFTHKTNKYMSGNSSRHFYGIIKHVACVGLLSHVSYCKNKAAQRTNIKMSPLDTTVTQHLLLNSTNLK